MAGAIGFKAKAEEKRVCDGANGEDAAGIFAANVEGFREGFGIAIGQDAARFERAKERGFASVLPIATGDEVGSRDGIEVPVGGRDGCW